MSTANADGQIDAVLCEGGKAVILYRYRGEELISTRSQPLPLPINEGVFDELRSEWEQAWRQSRATGCEP